MTKPFSAERFTATQWDSADDKAKAANALAAFVEAGMPESRFTKSVYHTLYQHMFSHIAHFDRYGFFATWFSTAEQRAEWIAYALRGGIFGSVGDPAFTWSDVEAAFTEWLGDSDLPGRFEREARDTVETRERAQLAALEAKYRPAVAS